ncbi:MAG: hypothetical protein HY890_01175 [Deltaproteobacteria bacterium]|nr:hypothetical protein [Deltaproteobacteria bacterium]
MRFLIKHKGGSGLGERGVAFVLVIGAVVFFLIFFLVFIDVAYVYYVRGQLHNAADAATLAAVAKTQEGSCSLDRTPATTEAILFASKNSAAGEPVAITSGDVIYGRWDGTTRLFTSCAEDSAVTVNAVKVIARKTVGLVFGRLVNALNMLPGASAIATRPPRAEVPFAICIDTCDIVPGKLYFEHDVPANQQVAWTLLQDNPSVNSNDLSDFICNGTEVKACGKSVYVSGGEHESVLKDLRCAFKDPLYDSLHKVCAVGACDTQGDHVLSWTVITAVLRNDNPGPGSCGHDEKWFCGKCLKKNEGTPRQYTVDRYAEIIITDVIPESEGGGSFCRTCPDYSPIPDEGEEEEELIKISGSIRCENCPNPNFMGHIPALVK